MDFLKQARLGNARSMAQVNANVPEKPTQMKPFSFKSESSLKSLQVRVICQQVTSMGGLQPLCDPVMVNLQFI